MNVQTLLQKLIKNSTPLQQGRHSFRQGRHSFSEYKLKHRAKKTEKLTFMSIFQFHELFSIFHVYNVYLSVSTN
jgi:hypothetical protein